MKSIKIAVSTLTPLSAAPSFADAFCQSFPPAKAIYAGLAILLGAAKGVLSSWDTLVELLESIEHFLNPLEIYTRIPRTLAMDEVIVKIMVELFSTLSLATRELKQGRSIKIVKKVFGEKGVEAALQRLNRLTQDEVRMTATETLEVVYGLSRNMSVVIDGGKASIDGVTKILGISCWRGRASSVSD